MSVTCNRPSTPPQVHEGAIVGDVLDHAFDDLLFLQRCHQRGAFLGAAFFQNGTARHHDIAAAAVHLQDLEQLRLIHQRADIAHRAHVNLRARQEGHGAVEVDGEAALDAAKDHAGNAGDIVERLFQLDPAFFAAGLVTGQDSFTERVLNALKVNFHRIAHLDVGGDARHGEFFEGDAAFGLQADVHHGEVVFNGDDGALDDLAFLGGLGFEALLQHRGEIFARRRGHGFNGTVFGCGASHSAVLTIVHADPMPHGVTDGLPGANPGRVGFWISKRDAL